ncbi:hypothetical protein BY996DRAFT_6497228 [Phakopsora pachyrhizi]|uniref:Uncharacterized protein n=1 Tax=Phakopsora pachyrhizi TaxID=170000 RepID=A0AAV0B3Q5_PHAPC|nr:hypothetical protein BY996DRAFT_6497228 [Phakopsora pachyrhizi]CAH7677063.1 hypothetical protein PPACK8108_LOCUS12188 [Phakopsora pachyrhizi]
MSASGYDRTGWRTIEDTSGVICVDGLVVSQEARTDRLDYDLSRWEPEEYEYLKTKTNQATAHNSSGHLPNDDYAIICTCLSKHSNYSSCFSKPGSTTIGQPSASKENRFNLMVNELNKKTKLGLHLTSKQMKDSLKAYRSRYGKAKKEISSTGFGLTEEDHNQGDPEQNTYALPQTTNMLPNLVEVDPSPVIHEQLFRFLEEDEEIREREDINPITNLDIITNDVSLAMKL